MILLLRFFHWMLELFRQCDIYFCYEKKPAELQLLRKIWLWSSSVIEIVNMKYNRIDLKCWLVSTSFKIYLEILSDFYITFTIFYYNTISLKRTFFPVLVKGLYQTESYSLHVMQLNMHLRAPALYCSYSATDHLRQLF